MAGAGAPIVPPPLPITAWAVTTGESGMRTQARGLAAAVARTVIEKTVGGGGLAWPGSRGLEADGLAPPWPELMITCGRRAAPRAIAVRMASGGRTVIVHVQDPRARADAFDLVVAMAHDAIAPAANVMTVATALHDVTGASLDEAARIWSARFAGLPRPLAGVVVGGNLRGRRFTRADARALLAGLRRLRESQGGGLAITPSRRTPPATGALLAEAFAADPGVFLWDLEGDNPYRAILALADRLVVTSDSVSMVSEALATGHPVEVFDLGFARHARFIQGLIDQGLVRRFTGEAGATETGGPIDATREAAVAVRALVQARIGVSG